VKFLGAAGAIAGLRLIWPAFLAGAVAGGVLALAAVVCRHARGCGHAMLILIENGSWRPTGNVTSTSGIRLPYNVPLSIGLLLVASISAIR